MKCKKIIRGLKNASKQDVPSIDALNKLLKNTLPSQFPKNFLRDLILSMDRGERRFFALKLKRYNKKDKDAVAVAKLYEILSRHASPYRDELEVLRQYAKDMSHLEQVRQRLIKMILFALVEYRYMKQHKNLFISVAETTELLRKRHISASEVLLKRVLADFRNAKNPLYQLMLIDRFLEITFQAGVRVDKEQGAYEQIFSSATDIFLNAVENMQKRYAILNNFYDVLRFISEKSFPVSKVAIGEMDKCLLDVIDEYLKLDCSVMENQVLLARLLQFALLFKLMNSAEALFTKLNLEYDLSNAEKLKDKLKQREIFPETAVTLIDWYVHTNSLNVAFETASAIIDVFNEHSFSSDFKIAYLLEAYTKAIPVGWYIGKLDRVIEFVEDGEYLLSIADDKGLYSDSMYYDIAKRLFLIQSAVSYVTTGNVRFAKKIIDKRSFKGEIYYNKGFKLLGLIASFIVYVESDDLSALQRTINELYDIGKEVFADGSITELVNILEALFVYNEKAYLKEKLVKAYEILRDLKNKDPLFDNVVYHTAFMHWLKSQIEHVPFREELSKAQE